jgi:hypothetical protein
MVAVNGLKSKYIFRAANAQNMCCFSLFIQADYGDGRAPAREACNVEGAAMKALNRRFARS